MTAIDGDPKTGWGVQFGEQRNAFLALRFTKPLETAEGEVIAIKLRHDSDLRRASIGRFRVALSSGEYSFPEPLQVGSRIVFTDMMQYSFVKNTTFNGTPRPDLAILDEDGNYRVLRSFGYEDYRHSLGGD